MISINKIYNEKCEDTIKNMPDDFLNLIITSPPYFGCRQYGNETLGREADPRDYVNNVFNIINSLKRVLKKDGSLYLNIGDVYFGTKGFSRNKGKFSRKTDKHYQKHKIVKQDKKYLQHKQLLMLPSRIAIKLQDEGWILRNNIIWEKLNPIPSFSKDRRLPCYEYIFHFVKSKKYYFDYKKAKENCSHRDLIRLPVKPFNNHPASFNEELISPLIETTSKKDDLIYDPFSGSGTTCYVAKKLGRNFIGSEINKDYSNQSKITINEVNDLIHL